MEFDFSKNTVVDDIEKVPSDFRGLYEPVEGEEGKHKLSDSAQVKSAVAAIQRMNSSLKAARTEAKKYKAKVVDLGSLSDFGETPEEILEAFQGQVEGLKTDRDKTVEQRVEKIKEDLAKGEAKKLELASNRSSALEKQLFALLGTGAAKSALKDLGAVDVDIALPFLLNQLKPMEKDGEFVVRVVDAAGDTRYSGTSGAEMTVKEAAAEMKTIEKYGLLFSSETPQGGGTQPGSTSRPAPGKQPAELSAVEKIAAGLKKGQHDSGGR